MKKYSGNAGNTPFIHEIIYNSHQAYLKGIFICLSLIALVALLLVGCANVTPDTVRAISPTPITASPLGRAAFDLSRDAGENYAGTVTTTTHGTFLVNLNMTNVGVTRGTLTQNGTVLQYMAIDKKAFIQASQAFWQKSGLAMQLAKLYSQQWVKVPPDEFGLDFGQTFAPGRLGAQLLQAAETYSNSAGTVTQLQGVPVKRIVTPEIIIYVTDSQPYHIIEIASLKTTASTSSLAVVGTLHTLASTLFLAKSVSLSNVIASDSDYELSTNALSDAQQEQLLQQLGSNIGLLRDSLDAEVQFSLNGSVILSPCNQTTCTAIATISNSLTVGDSRVQANTTINVEVVITMTLDGQPLNECNGTITILLDSSGQFTCSEGYTLPADGRTHLVRADVWAVGEADVYIDPLYTELQIQTLSWRLRQAGNTGLPGWSDTHGPFRFIPPKGYNPQAGPLRKQIVNGQRGYVDIYGDVWYEGGAEGLAAAKGYPYEWDVILAGGAPRSFWNIVRNNHANIAPDGYQSH